MVIYSDNRPSQRVHQRQFKRDSDQGTPHAFFFLNILAFSKPQIYLHFKISNCRLQTKWTIIYTKDYIYFYCANYNIMYRKGFIASLKINMYKKLNSIFFHSSLLVNDIIYSKLLRLTRKSRNRWIINTCEGGGCVGVGGGLKMVLVGYVNIKLGQTDFSIMINIYIYIIFFLMFCLFRFNMNTWFAVSRVPFSDVIFLKLYLKKNCIAVFRSKI